MKRLVSSLPKVLKPQENQVSTQLSSNWDLFTNLYQCICFINL